MFNPYTITGGNVIRPDSGSYPVTGRIQPDTRLEPDIRYISSFYIRIVSTLQQIVMSFISFMS